MMNDPVKIGCSAVLSGHEGIHGKAIVQAVSLAVDQANSKGVIKGGLELIVGDDRDERGAAADVARRFISDKKILGVVGPMNNNAVFAAAPLYQMAEMVHISPAASNPELTSMGYSAFFRVVGHDKFQGTRAAEFTVLYLKKNRIGVIHDGSSFGKPLAEFFMKQAQNLGAEIITLQEIQRTQRDFSDVANEMVSCQPDLIFFGVIEEEGLRLAPQLRAAGVDSIFFGTDGLKSSRYLETPQYDVKGPYYSNASADLDVKASAHAFKEAFVQRYGPTYSVYSAEAYDAANVMIHAMTKAEKLTRQSVLSMVAKTNKFQGINGQITFDSYGDRMSPEIGFYELTPGKTVFLGFDRDILGVQSSTFRDGGNNS
jgi:branched-chain amino acid transport system substrate-binding protein